MMKNFYSFLCFLILFENSSPAATGQFSEPCDAENFRSGYFVGNLLAFKDFVQFLADMGIDTTSKFINLKNEGGLPDGVSDAPLEDYPELKGQWSHLWNRVREVSSSSIKENRAVERKPSLLEETGHNQIQTARQAIAKPVSKKKRKRQPAKVKPRNKSRKSSRRVVKSSYGPSKEKQSSQTVAELPRYQTLSERKKEEFLNLVIEYPKINRTELAQKLGVSKKVVDQIIAVLKRENRLARAGGNKGRWIALQPGVELPHYDPLEEKKEEFLDLVAENSRITRAKLAEKMGVTIGAVDYIIVVLKKENRLVRRNSRWEVITPIKPVVSSQLVTPA